MCACVRGCFIHFLIADTVGSEILQSIIVSFLSLKLSCIFYVANLAFARSVVILYHFHIRDLWSHCVCVVLFG